MMGFVNPQVSSAGHRASWSLLRASDFRLHARHPPWINEPRYCACIIIERRPISLVQSSSVTLHWSRPSSKKKNFTATTSDFRPPPRPLYPARLDGCVDGSADMCADVCADVCADMHARACRHLCAEMCAHRCVHRCVQTCE